MHSGDEDSQNEGAAPASASRADDADEECEHWTPRRIEKAGRRGLDLKRPGERWELKIAMSNLDPPLTEAGMERYCRWLRVRLSAFRDENGVESLRRCCGEVDFSHNNMGNQMVWMLLETLAQHEVHIAQLKLHSNRISQGGVLAICELIRMNERADPIEELHLSHNEVDDDSALELMRTFHFQRPRYPPRCPGDGSGDAVAVPVLLRLDHNRIRDPDAVRKSAETEGITICSTRERSGRRECPLLHLDSFGAQANRTGAEHASDSGDEARQPSDEVGERERPHGDGERLR